MAKKDKKRVPEEKEDRNSKQKKPVLKESTMKSVWGISLFVLSLLFLLAAFDKGGPIGTSIYHWLKEVLLGYGYYLLPISLFILALSLFGDKETSFPMSKNIGTALFIISGLGLFHIVSPASGGVVGMWIALPLVGLFDYTASSIILVAVLVISLLVICDASLKREHFMFWKMFGKEKELETGDKPLLKNSENLKLEQAQNMALNGDKSKGQTVSDIKDKPSAADDEKKMTSVLEAAKNKLAGAGSEKDKADELIQISRRSALLGKPFIPPPLSLLNTDTGKPDVGDIKANANIIKRTLQNFGIDVEMDEVSIGPSVTRYAMKPAEGVKLSKILGLQNNLSLALAAHPIRIEAPIPGKSLVGIEIPNNIKTTVSLGTMLANDDFQKSEKPLLVALGKGISGKSYFDNLAKMPHLLIAGATGSGKSVTIHTIITSLLYRNSAEALRMIMIDPKRVELTLYNKIPHLLTPVITDAKKAILSLKWAAKEMDRRYNILEQHAVRDIDSYHKTVLMPTLERTKGKKESELTKEDLIDPMPYIVIVIDELADIMQTYPRELEAGIVRLAQMSRAVGIHLILSTQRPSVNVITGLIKANVPARIALQVASQIDSRTILDMRGAEELLGAGDMLFLSGEMSTPRRVQSAYVSETEVKKVVKYLVGNMESLPSEITLTGENITNGPADPVFSSGFSSENDEVDDDLYEEAKQTVIEAGKASTSYIQRKLRVGYARAARLMDILEERGVIGPADGSKPREVMQGRDEESNGGQSQGPSRSAEPVGGMMGMVTPADIFKSDELVAAAEEAETLADSSETPSETASFEDEPSADEASAEDEDDSEPSGGRKPESNDVF
jgi:S-DNA-T family DNA segregation ATPase FtsK/SpoIIIE